jgi:hypothetical protein
MLAAFTIRVAELLIAFVVVIGIVAVAKKFWEKDKTNGS